jgi:NADP-dependent 3-hydroxy acid dehydrogenase YdfG
LNRLDGLKNCDYDGSSEINPYIDLYSDLSGSEIRLLGPCSDGFGVKDWSTGNLIINMERVMGVFADKIALVTGGGTGIGRAIALDLAATGATVVVCGRRQGPLDETVCTIVENGGNGHAVCCDLTNPDAIEAFAAELQDQHGTIDILINNAGFSSKVRSARHIRADDWQSVMDVNAMGPAMLTRCLLEGMIQKGAGDVVMISSVAAPRPGILSGSAYGAAKAAARAYMEALAHEVQSLGIRCITVFPGEVDTPILDNRPLPPDQTARATMMLPEDISAAVMMALTMPRRTLVSEMTITATTNRDRTADIAAALAKTEP